jgi:hypothetical protein
MLDRTTESNLRIVNQYNTELLNLGEIKSEKEQQLDLNFKQFLSVYNTQI